MSEQAHLIPAGWLVMYHDGELDAARRERFEAHLATCASCQRELAELKSVSGMLAVDRLADDALGSRSVFWHELEPRLPDRAPVSSPPLEWLPGIALLMANGLLQFLAVLSSVVMLLAGQFPWAAQTTNKLNLALVDLLVGWPADLLPVKWSSWGASILLVVAGAWLAVLYLAWLGFVWRYREHSAARLIAERG
jgi:anti-sigma factor RsiW